MKCTNAFVGFLNVLTLLISLPLIGVGLWFRLHAGSQCEKFLELPIIILGASLFVVAILGLLGSCCRVSSLLWIYLSILFLLILSMVAFTAFVLIVTNKSAGDSISGKMVNDLKLGDYSNWLQKQVSDYKTWQEIEACMKGAEVCGSLEGLLGEKANEFYTEKISVLQSGCCKPPTYCGFVYKNATYWTTPKSGLNSTDVDCKTWSNDQEKLCYGCNSCKLGLLSTLKNGWKAIAIFNTCLIVLLIIVYSFGCCALRNNRSAGHYAQYYRGAYR